MGDKIERAMTVLESLDSNQAIAAAAKAGMASGATVSVLTLAGYPVEYWIQWVTLSLVSFSLIHVLGAKVVPMLWGWWKALRTWLESYRKQ